jgi:hypothetical protein
VVSRLGALVALALGLMAAPACHEAAQRGIWSIGPDPLVGCWRDPTGQPVLLVDEVDYRGPPLSPDVTQPWTWARETRTLLSISADTAGVRTIQTDFSDSTHVTLSYTSGTELTQLELTRDDSDAGGCQ